MDLLLFGDNGWGRQLLSGFGVTLTLASVSYLVALFLGVGLAYLASSERTSGKVFWKVYSSIMMGVPSLLVVFFVFYNLPALFKLLTGKPIDISQMAAGIIALSLVYSSYLAEVLRGAIGNIPKGQFDAGRALGLGTKLLFAKVIIPQIWRLALPGLSNVWLVVLKDTVLVSLVGLTDVVRVANLAAGNTGRPFLFYITVGLAFVVLALSSEAIVRYAERQANRPYVDNR